MKSRPVEIQEIDHLSVQDAVDEVSYRSSQDEGKRRDQPFFTFRQSYEHRHNEAYGDEGEEHKERDAEARGASGKNTECRSGIADVR